MRHLICAHHFLSTQSISSLLSNAVNVQSLTSNSFYMSETVTMFSCDCISLVKNQKKVASIALNVIEVKNTNKMNKHQISCTQTNTVHRDKNLAFAYFLLSDRISSD